MWSLLDLDDVLDKHPHFTHMALTVLALFMKPLIEDIVRMIWRGVGKLFGKVKL